MSERIYHTEPISELRFLITGGAGFIGSNIAFYLLTHGARKVRIIDNLSTGKTENIEDLNQFPAFEFINADITNFENCVEACKNIDFVSHQAALGSVPRSLENPLETNYVNTGGTVNMAIAARDCNVRRFVYASSSSVYGDERSSPKQEDKLGNCLSPYAVSKISGELYLNVFTKNYGMETIGLRYFNAFGFRQNVEGPYAAVIPIFIQAMLEKRDIFIDGDGSQTRDFTFVDNIVQANIRAMLSPDYDPDNNVFNIAGGEAMSVDELFHSLAEHTEYGHKANYRDARAGDIKHSLADISRAKTVLGYKPEVNLHEGLKYSVDWFKHKQ